MKERSRKITDLAVLPVFAIFALCVLLVLLSGVKVYRQLVTRGEETFAARTAAQYVTMRVRQAERVSVTDFEGCEALTVSETIDGSVWLTRVYCYEGYLRELYCGENAALSPGDGEKILPVESLGFSLENDLLTVRFPGREVLVCLNGKGAAP